MSLALLLAIRLYDGRFHGCLPNGQPEWPPSPARLFQALVAGVAKGAVVQAGDRDTLCWLEGLDPPVIAIPAMRRGSRLENYVPNNDLDSKGGDPRRIGEIKAAKRIQPLLFDALVPFLYIWSVDDQKDRALKAAEMADRLYQFGRGVDMAWATGEVLDAEKANARLAGHPGTVYRPSRSSTGSLVACPQNGSLNSLIVRHEKSISRFKVLKVPSPTRRDPGRVKIAGYAYSQPPKVRFAQVLYASPAARLLFDLRRAGEPVRFRAVPQERTTEIVVRVRGIAADRLGKKSPALSADIERFVVGRGASNSDIARRIRIVPLPSIGFQHTNPAIRRLLVEIPPDFPFHADEVSWALSGGSIEGFQTIDPETGEIDEAILVPADDQTMLGHYGVGGERFRRWRTVTPIALPERRMSGRRSGAERLQAEERAAAAITDALRHAGLPWRGVSIRVQREPFHARGERADAFVPDRFAGRLTHAEVAFPEPVAGPLVIGDGRFLGLGLMQPVRTDGPPAVRVFAVEPAVRPIGEAEALARALRRATMARVDAELADRRGRRLSLPAFFTGHEESGAPLRSGQHRHLFFLADDADGDGRIDRLAIVAPHLADRSLSGAGPDTRRNLRLLGRAVDGFAEVRAGSAGVLRLVALPELREDDVLFGRARRWMSRTPYLPTRHPKKRDVAAVASDILAECARRGLPRPQVEIVEEAVGPRGGIAVRARLTFAAVVTGPLLLGRNSHFGAGLFAVVR